MKSLAILLLAASFALAQSKAKQTAPPPPVLEFAFELTAQVAAPDKIPASFGERRIVPILGGTVTGPLFTGRVLPGGADYQRIHPDGFSEIEAHYVLETADGDRAYVTNVGMRHAPSDIIAKLNAGQAVDPALVYFRTSPTFETSAPKLQWLTRSLFVCTGERYPEGVKIRFYRVK